MSASRHEVVVVGAGPAGSTAAKRLALAGRDVFLLEKFELDRRRSCAGGISPPRRKRPRLPHRFRSRAPGFRLHVLLPDLSFPRP